MSARAGVIVILSLGLALTAAGCGAGKVVQPRPETVVGTIAAQTLPEGDAEAGKGVFTSQGCGGCHTLGDAGTNGTTGPNLDEVLTGKDAEFIRESIVNPNAEIAQGFQPNIMPQDYGTKLSQQQLADLVTYLSDTAG